MRGVPVEVPARNQQERDIRGRIVGYQLGVGVMHEDLKKAWRRRGFLMVTIWSYWSLGHSIKSV